jgi:hypothetical protein
MLRSFIVSVVFILFALTAVACAPTQVAAPAGPTTAVTVVPTQLPSAAPTATAAPLPSATPEPQATAPASASSYQGFVVYDAEPGKFTAYDFQGKPLGFMVDAGPQFVGRSPNETQVVNDAIYYRGEDQTIIRADAQGSRQLEKIPAKNLSTYQVSPDEQLIAWASDLWDATPPRSELWVASLDGSQARQIMTSTAAANGAFFTVRPYGWTDDGQLLIVQMPTGIGGYILYQAYSTLHVYDPQTGEIKPLYQPETEFRMCLSGVSPDVRLIGFGCDDAGAGKVSIRTVADGQTTSVPDLPEQNVAGSLHFSPSSTWLAYSIARRDPENERGQVAVVPVDLSSAPQIIASQDGGYYDVIGWIDEDTVLLFLTHDGQGTIWRVNKDGSDLTQIATGSFVAGLLSKPAVSTSSGLVRYQGSNAYRSTPALSVDYDPVIWEFVEKDGSGREPRLDHRSIPQCSVWLKAGPMGAQPVATAQLAGYEWTIFQVQPDILMYSIPWDDISFIFGLILPEPYTPDVKSHCQLALEDVMQTFQVVTD